MNAIDLFHRSGTLDEALG
jgi:hypothetical protein